MPARAIAALWARFSHLYGNRWVSVYGEALSVDGTLQPVAATWAKALGPFSGDDLARGLHACLDRPGPFLPDLPEFRALCLPPAKPKLLAPYHKPFDDQQQRGELLCLESDNAKAARLENELKAKADRKARASAAINKLKAMLRQGAAPA